MTFEKLSKYTNNEVDVEFILKFMEFWFHRVQWAVEMLNDFSVSAQNKIAVHGGIYDDWAGIDEKIVLFKNAVWILTFYGSNNDAYLS